MHSTGLSKKFIEVLEGWPQKAIEALKRGCAESVGKCMIEAQAEFDRYATPISPKHLTSPVLHKVLEFPKLKEYVYGGKGVGSQGDGSTHFVAKSLEDQARAMKLIEDEFGMACLPLTLGGSNGDKDSPLKRKAETQGGSPNKMRKSC